MDITDLQDGRLTVKASRYEVRILEVSIRAGIETDPHIRNVSDERTAALQKKMVSILSELSGDTVTLSFSRQEFLEILCIVEGVNYSGLEVYFPAIAHEFPPEDDLDRFARHIEDLYSRAFRTHI